VVDRKEAQIRDIPEIAVFTRNHRIYLDSAKEIGALNPKQSITFRAEKPWVSAASYLETRAPRRLYVVPIDGDGWVEFVADLHEIHLNPKIGELKTKELLTHVLPSTEDEGDDGLWGKTLYVIKNCRKLPRSFPQTELIKVSDRKPLSKDYKRSYSIVYAHA
jgi:hypothetical protein